ncbi:MAG: hypothetical protein KGH78_03995 [Candidatus Micrarchaeota archaeon]|nr:hypothetical protein [Candidatus Micrarchaeota archaeon]
MARYKEMPMETIVDMLKVSEADFKRHKDHPNVNYLRNAANKLIAIAENLTENRIGRKLYGYGDFETNFKRHFKDSELFSKLDKLHVFFYTGLLQDQSFSEIEFTYGTAKKRLRNLIIKVEKEKVRQKVRA